MTMGGGGGGGGVGGVGVGGVGGVPLAPGLVGVPPPKVSYNPADFAGLKVSDDIKELFGYITAYTPHAVELDARLRPFIPEYMPAIGDVDPFVKPPRPDGKEESLGTKYLDEPSAAQSDPTVLNLQVSMEAESVQTEICAKHAQNLTWLKTGS